MAEILSNAKYVMKDIEDSYLNPEAKDVKKSHKGVKYWYKFKNTIYMDEVLFDVVFNVRDKGGNQYQYLVEFHKKEDNSNQPYGHKDLRRTLDELSPTDNIPQNVPIVNSNSMQNFNHWGTSPKLRSEFLKISLTFIFIPYHNSHTCMFCSFDDVLLQFRRK